MLPLDAASAMALAKGWLLGNGACGGMGASKDGGDRRRNLYASNVVISRFAKTT